MPDTTLPDSTHPALHFDGVTAAYGARTVLRDVQLSVRPGEMLGVLGPNGAGKTTLLRLACGLIRPREGQVHLGGDEVSTLSRREVSRRAAALPQDAGPVFAVRAIEVVLMGRHPWRPAFAFDGKDDLEAARRALDEVDALDLAERDVMTLSGGERQRVLLARALCQAAPLLLCDEPTAHLDLRHQALTFRLLQRVRDAGRTVVVVTHDVELAAQACDRIALLGTVGVEAVGTPEQVVTPEHLGRAFGIAAAVDRAPDGGVRVARRLREPGA